jgi:3-oxoacyl-[acyl-carrier-protein] synthase II
MSASTLALAAMILGGSDAVLLPAHARAAAPRMAFGAGAAAPGERIVVTGVGVVSALGSGEQFWSNLLAGKSGIRSIQGFDASPFPTTIGAECLDFEAKSWFDNIKNAKATDRYSHMALAAARMAIADAKLPDSALQTDRAAIILGTAFGGMDTFEKQVCAFQWGMPLQFFLVQGPLRRYHTVA